MKNKHLLLVLMAAFVIIQPIIDLLTTASILLLNINITVGVIIRTLYLLVMCLFIVYAAFTFKSRHSKIYLTYLIGLAIVVAINFAVNYVVKDPFYVMQELTFYSKAIYFHVLFFGFLLIIEELRKNGTDTRQQLVNYFLLSSLIISAVFIIAQVTGTALSNYARSKEGWTGWFYAGNEVGAIMAILIPIVALFAVQRTNTWKDYKYWVPFVLLAISMLALGTKVGYGGILIVILSVLIGSIIMMVWKKSLENKQKVKANLQVSFVLLMALILVTPFTPVFGNMYAHFDILGLDFDKKVEIDPDTGEEIPLDEDEPVITGADIENLIFSSREQYAAQYNEQFKDAPMIQKIFGMGYAGNYDVPTKEKPIKMIEMDFHDWFYAFGVFGFLYMMVPILYFAGKYLWGFVRNISTKFDYFHILTGVAFLLGVGISYTAGHVLTAPSVAIYLSFLLAALVIHQKMEDER